MNNVLAAAIAKGMKFDRDSLTPGEYNVDQLVHVKGSFTVGVDTKKAPTVSIPLLSTLALFVKYSGVTGPAAVNALRQAMIEALNTDEKGEEVLLNTFSFIKDMKEQITNEIVAKLPKTDVKGSIKAKVTFEEVSES